MNNKTDLSNSSSLKKIIQVQTFTFQFQGNAKLIFYSIKNKFSKSDKDPVFWLNCCVHVPQVKIKTCFLTLPNDCKSVSYSLQPPNPSQLRTQAYQNWNAVIKRCTFILNLMRITSPQENKWLPPSFTVNVVVVSQPIWQKVIPHAILDNDTLLQILCT